MKKSSILFCLFFVSCSLLKAQSIQLFTEDFQTGGGSITQNGVGFGSNGGNNQWIVNNQYTGTTPYPNTIRQDSTYNGTIGGAPYSKYLHIHDAASSSLNCNYDPTAQSDRFAYMTNGMCTLGMDSVHFSFFYLCEGSATAYGKVYYSINNGPWIQTGQGQYKNKYKWKYEDITNIAFSNVANLRFGFRWENDNGAAPYSSAFAIDDINIVASYNQITPITITVDSVSPNPICQGTYISIHYHLSGPLCDGAYLIELSNSSGNFPGGFTNWIFNISYPQTGGTISVQLPNGATPSTCYKFRISRTSPPPVITGIASACFTIKHCDNTITTLQPVVTMDTAAVCIGSAIDIPFYSTGVFTFNTYTAQLSDSNGNFTSTPLQLGTFANSDTYDPALGSDPGSVSGQIPPTPPGCNYYIRVISSNPADTGSRWGPFCIRQCDITTNNKQDLSYCVTDCSVAPLGQNTNIPVDINSFNSTAAYGPGNVFNTQLMSSMTFAQIGNDGILGHVAATHDTILKIHIPCKDSLSYYGIPVGMNYMRVVATNSSTPGNTLGSLIRVTIGATHTVAPVISAYDYSAPYDFTLPYPWKPRKDTFCVGEVVIFYFSPYNYSDQSNYEWASPQFNGGNPFSGQNPNSDQSPYVWTLTGAGTFAIRVRETNNGCNGPWSAYDTVVIHGPPNVVISGASPVCQGDTNHYQVPFENNTYYHWTASSGIIVDTANNVIDIKYPNISPPNYTITIHAINSCGSSSATKSIQVKPYPIANAGHDTTVCVNQPVVLNTPTGVGYHFSWTDGTSAISTANTVTVSPLTTTTYTVTVTGPGGCAKKASVKVQVQTPALATFADSTCPDGNYPILLSTDSAGTSYLWNPGGATTNQISVTDTGTYVLQVHFPNAVCPKIETFHVKPDVCPVELKLPNVFSPNGDGKNDFFTPISPGKYGVYDFDKFFIKIYNRWGELIFESTDPYFKWNGTNAQGKPMSDGVYYYIGEMALKSGSSKTLAGFVSLIR